MGVHRTLTYIVRGISGEPAAVAAAMDQSMFLQLVRGISDKLPAVAATMDHNIFPQLPAKF